MWTKKADFGGVARRDALGFSIGKNGYISTVQDPTGATTNFNDIWKFDTTMNTWTQKTSFTAGKASNAAFGFAMGNYGYVVGGRNSTSALNDVWAYSELGNSWTKKNDFGGVIRSEMSGFVIGSKAYIGTGLGTAHFSDFWAYDPTTDTWTPETSFPDVRQEAVAASAGGKGYYGFGSSNGVVYNDWWEFEPNAVNNISDIERKLNANFYPNPANNKCNFKFYLDENTDIEINLYDLSGKGIQNLPYINYAAGNHDLEFDLHEQKNGTYYLKMTSNNFCIIKKIEIIK